MTSLQRKIVRAMMDANGNVAEAGRIVKKSRNGVCYHIEQVQIATGLNMRSARDLLQLYDMAKSEDEHVASVQFCAKCGAELGKLNTVHTRITACDDYCRGEARCVDVNLCVTCSAKVIAYAKMKEVQQ